MGKINLEGLSMSWRHHADDEFCIYIYMSRDRFRYNAGQYNMLFHTAD